MRLDEIVATNTSAASAARAARLAHERKVKAKKRKQKRLNHTDSDHSMVDGRFVGGVDTTVPKSKKVKEEQVNEISLKTKAKAYSQAMDPDFDYYADGTHNPKRKMGQADRLRAAIAKKHGQKAADQADDQAAYDHYGDYMFKDRKIPAHVKQREAVNELSDKRLKKYVKKATKSADALEYYSDSRNDPDWDKAQKRKRMVDVAKKKLGESAPPGMEDTVLKLKKQYPGDESKAFATAWSIYNKKKGKKPVSEAMPASIIKAKQAYASKSPEELLAAFKEVSERTGKSIQVLAYAAAMRHGYTDINTYWKRIQGLV